MINIKSGVDFRIPFVWKKQDGTADTGLSPTIKMYKLSDDTLVLNGVAMTEVALGIYKYNIVTANLVSGQTYAIQADGTASADDATLRYQYMGIAVDYQPTVGAIADAVWDEDKASHTTADTYGAYLDQKVSLAGTGNGAVASTITIRDVDGDVEDGVVVAVYSDAGMTNPVTDTNSLFTDSNGKVTVYLPAGTYYVKATKTGLTFSNPTTLTIT